MSKVKEKFALDLESKTIYITNTVTVQDIASLINPLIECERKQDGWPSVEQINWIVVVEPKNS